MPVNDDPSYLQGRWHALKVRGKATPRATLLRGRLEDIASGHCVGSHNSQKGKATHRTRPGLLSVSQIRKASASSIGVGRAFNYLRQLLVLAFQSPRASFLFCLGTLAISSYPIKGVAQTPSPLQEWQYSAGVDLMKMFVPVIPTWQVDIGLAGDERPLYEGSKTYRTLGGPVIDIRYQDLAFFSVGEGVGVNLIRGTNYRAGIAIGYDLGRRDEQDLTHLSGLGDVGRAPVVKGFVTYVVSKEFPLVFRVDVRKIISGARGWVGDIEAYLPLPGSSEKLVLFAGPSVTFADRLHMQTLFGISEYQSDDSGYPVYRAHAGLNAAGFGFSGTRFLSKRWLLNLDFAANREFGSAIDSPIVQSKVQGVATFSVIYRW